MAGYASPNTRTRKASPGSGGIKNMQTSKEKKEYAKLKAFVDMHESFMKSDTYKATPQKEKEYWKKKELLTKMEVTGRNAFSSPPRKTESRSDSPTKKKTAKTASPSPPRGVRFNVDNKSSSVDGEEDWDGHWFTPMELERKGRSDVANTHASIWSEALPTNPWPLITVLTLLAFSQVFQWAFICIFLVFRK
jgi:hypothetical protein